jgi:ribonucleoside-triphosphate reductase class III catalytic subunit (EC 1.17.4.2)
VPFDETKITDAIFKAARAVGGEDRQTALELTIEVLKMLKTRYNGQVFGVEDVQDIVEKVLIEAGHARTAKAYILYRDRRTRIREAKSELMDVVEEIIKETDRENANVGNSPSAKMLQIASAASSRYYLTRLLDDNFSAAHSRGDSSHSRPELVRKNLKLPPTAAGQAALRGVQQRPRVHPAPETAQLGHRLSGHHPAEFAKRHVRRPVFSLFRQADGAFCGKRRRKRCLPGNGGPGI